MILDIAFALTKLPILANPLLILQLITNYQLSKDKTYSNKLSSLTFKNKLKNTGDFDQQMLMLTPNFLVSGSKSHHWLTSLIM